MSNVGVKISVPGIDVIKTQDPRQTVIWSKYNPLMITQYGHGVVIVGNLVQSTDTNNIVGVKGSGGTNEGYAESFIASNTQITSVAIKLFKTGSPGDNFVINLTTSLGGSSLGSVSVPSASLTSGVSNTFTFSSPIALTPGTTYWVQATRSGARDTSNFWSIFIAFQTHPYPQGTSAVLASGTWGQSSDDLISNWNFTLNYSGTSEAVIAHGLGYAPMSLRYYELDNNGRFWLQGTQQGSLSSFATSGAAGGRFDLTDRTNLTFTAGNSGNVNVPFRYILLNEGIFDAASGGDKPVGYQSSNVGFKISRPGVEVKTAKLYQQVANSNCDFLKFNSTTVLKFTFDTFANGELSLDFVHGLGYVPLFVAYGYFDSSVQEHNLPIGHDPNPLSASAFADINKVTTEVCWAGGGVHNTVNFYVRIVVFKNNMLG